jgi:Zn-dependent protease
MLDAILLIIFAALPAIVLHEFAHGYVAYRLGDPTAKKMGRLTLNPIKHVDLLGTKSLLLFGWAKPVPVDFRQLNPRRFGMIAVAVAGPLVNIALAWISILLYNIPALSSWNYVLGWGILLNLTLAVFNMLPIPPLDGSRVLMGILPAQWARQYAKLEPFGLVLVVVLLQLGMLQFLYPLVSQLGYLLGIQI